MYKRKEKINELLLMIIIELYYSFLGFIKLNSIKLKHSQLIGIFTSFLVIAVCFLPWSIVVEQQIVIKGIIAKGTDFGRPGFVNIFLSCIMILFFSIQQIWAKRINLFMGAINFAWSFRNYLLVTSCYLGQCPEKQIGIYLLLLFSFAAMIMTFLPKIDIPNDED